MHSIIAMNNKKSCIAEAHSKGNRGNLSHYDKKKSTKHVQQTVDLMVGLLLRSKEGCLGTPLLFIVLVFLVGAVIQNAYTHSCPCAYTHECINTCI